MNTRRKTKKRRVKIPQKRRRNKAHQANDRAVMKAYGIPIRETDEATCVAWLMRLYQERVAELDAKTR